MLRIRHLQMSVNADKGQFGVKRDFADGMNVIRAKNWAGESTLLQSIVYALGLEGMFNPPHDVPLPHALTDYLEYREGKANVIDSMVSLEIENGEGSSLHCSEALRVSATDT